MSHAKYKRQNAHERTVGVVDFRYKTSMPIRDMDNGGRIFCVVDVYGWTGRDLCMVPGGSTPIRHAIERLGLDPDRYRPVIWDAQV